MPHKASKSRAFPAGWSYDLVSDCCQGGQSDGIELDKMPLSPRVPLTIVLFG